MPESSDRPQEGGWVTAERRAPRPVAALSVSPGDGVRWVILSAAPPDDEDEAERAAGTTTRASRRGR